MNLDLAFKDIRPTEDLVKRLENKLAKMERLLHRPPTVRVTLSKERVSYDCLIHLHHRGREFVAHGTGVDIFVAADHAVSKLENQLNKERKRTVTRRQERVASA